MKVKKWTIILVMIGLKWIGHASDPVKELRGYRLNTSIHIDGILDEEAWMEADKAINFIQKEPMPGAQAMFKTEVYFLYDNHAVYIGARMWDDEPEKILREFSLRDELGNADNFTVFFDPFRSGLNGFQFKVTASGVQLDASVTNHEEDSNWNAVWESAVSQDAQGWFVEMKIPYSALRFPADPVQQWNIQFNREVRRYRESTYWSAVDPNIAGWVQQSGRVTGIENIKSPVRLSLTPYLSGYLNTSKDPNIGHSKTAVSTAYSAGMDLKYGLNDAFTLDMTLIPDFGQVLSDKQVLNLTPFEVFYEENRQFFTESTELFNKENIFYSRRIGGLPLKYVEVYQNLQEGERIIENPTNSRLFNATKISGRTSQGTGIGFFNAIVSEENAIIETIDGSTRKFKTNPLTNYNAIVVDQNLKHNSFISVMNTNVTRVGDDYDANVTGAYFNLKTKDQQYQVAGFAVMSQQFFESQTNRGYSYNLDIGKVSGKWIYSVGHRADTDKYNPNDMGFLLYPNYQNFFIQGGYQQYYPKNPQKVHTSLTGELNYSRLYNPNVYTGVEVSLSQFTLYKNRLGAGWDIVINPIEIRDYFEPRVADLSRYLALPGSIKASGSISTDYRKPVALDLKLGLKYFDKSGQAYYSVGFSPRFRLNNRFSLNTSTALDYYKDEPGFANKSVVMQEIIGLSPEDILFGYRNRLTVENAITGKYIFNAVMGLNIRVRHYWDKVLYHEFGRLLDNGHIEGLAFDGLDNQKEPIFDRNVNIFNVDLQYNWRFAPGSDIIVVWKNQIFNSDKSFDANWFSNFSSLSKGYQENNFSIRVLYYLDYLYLTK
ncbi:MAG: carbohydrate binding family 9 domain-containing protein [Chitinophagales bacterium]|nr:carbohydrate binding family 9 domain-containing protein [Chitinophagales bacterium]